MKITDSSIKYAYNAINTGKTVSFRKGIYDASILLSDLFKEKNKYDSAYKYLSIANTEKDSLTGPKRFQELQRIILDQQKRQNVNEAKRIATQNKQKQLALLAGLAIFLVVVSILYRNNKQKQKANKVLETTLTDLKSTQKQLIQSEKMASLGELTAGIAHEIQNPLNFVNNFSEVSTELIDEMNEEISKGHLDDAKEIANDLKQNLEKINHHGKRAGEIVKGMLQHSRTSSGQKEPTDINALCDEYLRLAYHGLRAKDKSFNAKFETEFDNSIDRINIIPQDIGRVILNLITNAFYAVNEKSKQNITGYEPIVDVSTKKEGKNVLITVKDNGSGISKSIVDKIFQPFFTTKPTGQGTGLGLSLSYDIVKAHGGEIKVETKENEGTGFLIILPFG
ncbi:MAG: GHKL domain-containing protein [Chitinophagaceae bacterium]|nr:GHKL domain-containing protein [Chitinophagaceae bacterium]